MEIYEIRNGIKVKDNKEAYEVSLVRIDSGSLDFDREKYRP